MITLTCTEYARSPEIFSSDTLKRFVDTVVPSKANVARPASVGVASELTRGS